MGITTFADITREEFLSTYLGITIESNNNISTIENDGTNAVVDYLDLEYWNTMFNGIYNIFENFWSTFRYSVYNIICSSISSPNLMVEVDWREKVR